MRTPRAGAGRICRFALVVVGGGLAGSGPRAATECTATECAARECAADLAGVPISFVENRGQLPGDAAYYVMGDDTTVELAATGLTYRQRRVGEDSTGRRIPSSPHVLALRFVGSDPGALPEGADLRKMRVHSYAGTPDRWRSDLATYGQVVYRELWPGIDLVYSGSRSRLKHELVVRPGADPSRIRLAWRGAASVRVDGDGALRVTTPVATLRDDPPYAYQEVAGERVEVESAYRLDASAAEGPEYGFALGEYDRARTLVIDPAQILYATYIGGAYGDGAQDVAVDAEGAAYVTGSIGNPANQSMDAFVLKVAPDGKSFVYLTMIGGDQPDEGLGVAVDAKGVAYVTGIAASRDFPSMGGPDTTFGGGVSDAFVAKVDAKGDLVFCGFIGGAKRDYGSDVAVDAAGNVYVTGPTRSPESSFPATVGPDLTHNGGYDLFVAKVASDGKRFLYAGYVGGDGEDVSSQPDGQVVAGDVAVDAVGAVYLSGTTRSAEKTFPTGTGFGAIPSWDATHNGNWDGFAVKVKADGTGLAWAGYVGGDGADGAMGIAVDAEGNAYVAGEAGSAQATFPTGSGFGDLRGLERTYGGNGDAWAAKVRADGTKLLWATYLGSADFEKAIVAAVDRAGDLHVVGNTVSSKLPRSKETFNDRPGGALDAFLVRLSADGTKVLSSGYLGGVGADLGFGVAVDPAGSSYVVGFTLSGEATFPDGDGMATRDGKERKSLGGTDGFLVKVSK